jgi:transporter family protein
MNLDWRVFALGSAGFAALTAVFAKVGVSEFSSNFATLYRTVIVLALTALIVAARHEWPVAGAWSAKGVLYLTLSGCATGLSWLCYFRAIQMAPVSRVAPIDKLSVVLVVIFAAALLGERLTWKVGAGAALITVGVILTAL